MSRGNRRPSKMAAVYAPKGKITVWKLRKKPAKPEKIETDIF